MLTYSAFTDQLRVDEDFPVAITYMTFLSATTESVTPDIEESSTDELTVKEPTILAVPPIFFTIPIPENSLASKDVVSCTTAVRETLYAYPFSIVNSSDEPSKNSSEGELLIVWPK